MARASAHHDEWGYWPHPAYMRNHCLSRRQAWSMSRRFAGVGVGIGAARLREIASGSPASAAELADVDFAVVASEFKHQERVAKFERGKRQCVNCLVIVLMALVLLGALLFVALTVLSLALHTTPFSL
ncbi:hypothetical protein MTY414_45590 [Mycolicibacterium mageritense]|nr:hypothetical protein MTY414_45590 [Mycolicibacterium mageritense]